MQPLESARPLERIIEPFLLPIQKFVLNYIFFNTLLTYIGRCYEKQPRKLIITYYYIFYPNGFEDIICYIALGFLLKTHRRNSSSLGSKNSPSPNHWLVLKLFHARNLVHSCALEVKKLTATHLGSYLGHFIY